MERKEFISNIGITLAAICTGCLAACSKSSSTPASVNFNVNLSSSLLNVGDSLKQNGVIIVRLAATNDPASFSAVQVACTHEGASINYNKPANIFICPLHGSRFALNGAVLQGPATNALQQFNVSVSGTTLSISA